MDRFFELVGKVCGNRADDLEGSRAPHVSRPKSLLDAWCRVADLALGAVVEKVNMSAHKLVTLLPPVCLVVALPCIASPCQASPSLAQPSLAQPSPAEPRPENVHLFPPDALVVALPRLAQPSHAMPSLAQPRHASPSLAMPCLEKFAPVDRPMRSYLPCLALPCRAWPRQARPCRATPRRALRIKNWLVVILSKALRLC